MSTGSTFPTTIDSFANKTDGIDDILAVETNTQSSAIEALEAKVGADSSAVVTSHDYKITSLETNLDTSAALDDYSLTVDSTLPAGYGWKANPAGFADPTTTIGDIIHRNDSNVTSRLAKGTKNQILSIDKAGTNLEYRDYDNLSLLNKTNNGILSGKVATDGFPDWLTAGGAADLQITLDCTTPFECMINGINNSSAVDMLFTITGGYDATNTCLVNDAIYAADPEFSKTEGEYGDTYITVDNMGANMAGLVTTYQFIEITNGAETELMYAYIDSITKVTPLYRGLAGTSRIAFTNNDTMTVGVGTHLFTDGTDLYGSILAPVSVDTLPAAGTAGLYAHRLSDDTWHLDSGAAWSQVERVPAGFAVAMNSTDSTYVGYLPIIHDIAKEWKPNISGEIKYATASTIIVPKGFSYSISGKIITLDTNVVVDLSDANDRETGVSEENSTRYDLYADDQGKFRLSNVCPRDYDIRMGRYHPSRYWRCVGSVYNDASGNIVPFIFDGYKYLWNDKQITTSLVTSLSRIQFLPLPPYVLNAEIVLFGTALTATQTIYVSIDSTTSIAVAVMRPTSGNTYSVYGVIEGYALNSTILAKIDNTSSGAAGTISIVGYSVRY